MKKAFTLAEVLITIGIVGVVAAMTIPNLINNYKAKKLRTQFLKAYSTISQALRAMEADEVPITKSAYPYSGRGFFHETFVKYLTGARKCPQRRDYTYTSGCATLITNKTSPYFEMNSNQNLIPGALDDGQILLNNGMLIMFEDFASLWITVDINGVDNKPNKIGYDVFTWELNNHEKLIPMGAKGTRYANSTCDANSDGWACTNSAQSNSDYFKWVVKNVK